MPNCKLQTAPVIEALDNEPLGLQARTRREKVLLHIIDAFQRENNRLSQRLADPEATTSSRERATLRDQVDSLERDLIITSLTRRNGVVSEAANELGITERMVRYKIQKLDIDHGTLFKKRRRAKNSQDASL